MRRLSRRQPRDEKGAVIVLLVGFSVAMIAMAALVVDVGSLLDEKRQLQNGADAGALAVAHTCATGPSCNPGVATKLANDNSRDNSSDVVVGAPDLAGRKVMVTTTTRVGGSTILPYSFGQILTGVKGKTVHASATAAWDFPGSAVAIPLTISPCDKTQLGIGVTAVINLGAGFGPCPGRDTSGAFGWLGLGCQTTIFAGPTLVNGSSGKSGPKDCLDSLKGTIVVLPVYDTVTGTGSGARYHIIGFAALRLTGWDFPGDSSTPAPTCSSGACVAGTFVNFVTASTIGGGADFGVFRVFLRT
jgi:hypothetical protein